MPDLNFKLFNDHEKLEEYMNKDYVDTVKVEENEGKFVLFYYYKAVSYDYNTKYGDFIWIPLKGWKKRSEATPEEMKAYDLMEVWD